MQILRVCDTETAKAFVHFPVRLYKHNTHWGHMGHQALYQLFDPERNPFFQHGEAERWIITNFRGDMIGRIAAFVCHTGQELPTGSIGFFECIDHPKAAFALFDHCKQWLERKNVWQAMAPHNMLYPLMPGGLLTDGFEEEALCGVPYHQPYYQNLFESYGFELQHEQHHYLADLFSQDLQRVCRAKAADILADQDFCVRAFDKKDGAELAQTVTEVYQHAWEPQADCGVMNVGSMEDLLAALDPFLDEKTAWGAFYKEQPVGFFLCLPGDAQKYIRSSKNVINKVKMLFQAGSEPKITALLMGVKQDFQHKGIAAALLQQLINEAPSGKKYRWLEMAGIEENNARLLQIMQQLEMKKIKTFRQYRYLIREAKPITTNEQRVSSAQLKTQVE